MSRRELIGEEKEGKEGGREGGREEDVHGTSNSRRSGTREEAMMTL